MIHCTNVNGKFFHFHVKLRKSVRSITERTYLEWARCSAATVGSIGAGWGAAHSNSASCAGAANPMCARGGESPAGRCERAGAGPRPAPSPIMLLAHRAGRRRLIGAPPPASCTRTHTRTAPHAFKQNKTLYYSEAHTIQGLKR